MKPLSLTLALGLLLAASTVQAAEPITGGTLAEQCHAAMNRLEGKALPPEGNIASAFCLGYLAGVEHLYTFMQSADPPPKFCLPADTPMGQVARTVTSYLRAHPEDQQINGIAAVLLALEEAYPCPSTR
jgi:hypothetical protein